MEKTVPTLMWLVVMLIGGIALVSGNSKPEPTPDQLLAECVEKCTLSEYKQLSEKLKKDSENAKSVVETDTKIKELLAQ